MGKGVEETIANRARGGAGGDRGAEVVQGMKRATRGGLRAEGRITAEPNNDTAN